MRFFLWLFLVFNFLPSIVIAEDCYEDSVFKKKTIVFAIKGNDCVNCYMIVAKTYNELIKKHNVDFVFSELPNRLVKDFIRAKIGDFDSTKSKIYPKEKFACFSLENSSSISIIDKNQLQLQYTFSKVDYSDVVNVINSVSPVDSLDISDLVGSNQTGYTILGNNLYIYNEVTNTNYQLDLNMKKLNKKFSFSFIKDSLNRLIKENVQLSDSDKVYNTKNLISKMSSMGGPFVFFAPYYTTKYIYQPLTLRLLTYWPGEDGKMNPVAMPTQYLIRLSHEGEIIATYSLPYYLPQNNNLYNMSYGGVISDNIFYAMMSSVNEDSLIAQYEISDTMLTLTNIYPLSYPSYFPRQSNTGRRYGYAGYFKQMDGEMYYSFNVDPSWYRLNASLTTIKPAGGEELFRDNIPITWQSYIMKKENSYSYFGGQMNSAIYQKNFDAKTSKLNFIRKISSSPITVLGEWNKQLLYINTDPERVVLYFEKLVD